MTLKMFEKIKSFLNEKGIDYKVMEHEHVHSSADAAKVRGTKLEEAAKALVLKTKSGVVFQAVVSGHRRLSLKKLKKLLGENNLSLAHPDVVLETTGCKVGTVPPFANLFPKKLDIYADKEIFSRDYVVFSAGTHNHSIRMKSEDWKIVTGAKPVDIGKEE